MDTTNFIETFNELLSIDNTRYFYHVTNQNPDYILQQGLFLFENRLSSTTIEIPEEFKKDPINYCLQEKGENYRKDPFIVLLGIPTEEVKYAIVKNYEMPISWDKEDFPKFVIPSQHIIGYINTSDFEITLNENYNFINDICL